MIRLAIVVEGATEVDFVNEVLAGHLLLSGVAAAAVLIGNVAGRDGGGRVSVARLAADMSQLYYNFDAVSSLVDFYGFQGKGDMSADELELRLLEGVRSRIHRDWDERRVIPYVQMHEFEALLFSNPGALSEAVVGVPARAAGMLANVRGQFPTPEDINDNPNTAPSRRIYAAIPDYDKRVDGLLAAHEIGLDGIRAECPRFDGWVSRLEGLGGELGGG